MKKTQKQPAQATQVQQNQTTFQGGAEMKKAQNQAQQQPTVYFVTFSHKLPKEQSKQVISELRKLYPGQPVFIRKPPAGRKKVIDINGVTVILTFPYVSHLQEGAKQEQENPMQAEEGFALKDLIKLPKEA